MAFWPFGRKKKKKAASDQEKMGTWKGKTVDSARNDPGQGVTDVNASRLGRRGSHRKGNQWGQRTSSTKLPKSQSQTRENEKNEKAAEVPPLPHNAAWAREPFNEKTPAQSNVPPPAKRSAHSHPNRDDIPSYYFQNPLSQSSIQPENFTATTDVPTLRPKKSATSSNMPSQKSSKRKAEDRDREKEIKAMSSPIPIPKRTSHRRDRPTSDISLPHAASMHSSRSEASDGNSFRISALDALSPRPTIRYSENPRYGVHVSSTGPSRASTRKDKGPSIPEEGFDSKEKIEDLADDLDATALRELMERDRRRRDKKRRTDQERLQRRLQRRADRQKAAEGSVEPEGSGVKGKAVAAGLGIGALEVNEQSKVKSGSPAKEAKVPASWLRDQSSEPSRNHSPSPDPFRDPLPSEQPSDNLPALTQEAIIVEPSEAVPIAGPQASPPASPVQSPQDPSYLSTLHDKASRSTIEIPERETPDLSNRRDSDTSARFGSSWTSFFRRSGARASRTSMDPGGRATPSEFSNTSRESFTRQPPSQLPLSVFARQVSRARSGTPVRTQSKFREDLPELPVSPPMSRVQSPSLGRASPSIGPAPGTPNRDAGSPESSQPLTDIHPALREGIAMQRRQSSRGPSPDIPNVGLLSRSLASVDSEGSWLAGRPGKRLSQQTNPLRTSAGSLHKRLRDMGASEDDIRNAGEQEESLAAQILARRKTRESQQATSDEDDVFTPQTPLEPPSEDQPTFHRAVGRKPTIIRRNSPRAKSREGLLDIFNAGEPARLEEEFNQTSPTEEYPSPTDDVPSDGGRESRPLSREGEEVQVHRATSVNLKDRHHVRHFSSGSARLMEVPSRSSGEAKRLSGGSAGESSSLREEVNE